MTSRVNLIWSAVIAVLILSAGIGMSSPPASAQTALDDPGSATEYFSKLENRERYSRLYKLMHPDAQDIIPEEAVTGWYEAEFAPREPGSIEIISVEYVEWTWDVNGETYRDAAEVTYQQEFGDGSIERNTIHLVEYRGDWLWFFGPSREFVNQQIALYEELEDQPEQSAPIPSNDDVVSAYSVEISCSAISDLVFDQVYAICDWPFAWSTAQCVFSGVLTNWSNSSFHCKPDWDTFSPSHPAEITVQFSVEYFYPYQITVDCGVPANQGFGTPTCEPPGYFEECILDPNAFQFGDEYEYLCRF